MRRYLRGFFFIIGLLLFAYLIVRLKPSVLLANLKSVGWNFTFILALSIVWLVSYSLAWEIFLKKLSNRVHLWEIFKIKVAGEAVNNVTPLSWGGGDPARILMLKEHIPLTEGTASVVVDRTLNNLAIALFMVLGVLMAFLRFKLPPSLEIGLPISLIFILGVSLFFFLRSHEGLFEFFVDLLRKLRIKKNFSEKTLHQVREIDFHISHFYKMNKRGFLLAFFFHFFGRVCGVVEIFLAALFIHHPLSLIDSYLLASMTVLVNIIFVFVPGTVGVLEGAFAGVFALLHLDPAIGTSIQMVRRVRMVFWTTMGFIFMTRMKATKENV